MEHLTLHTDDGHTLAARCYRPADVAVAVQRVVILAPALGVPQTFYERYARWLSGHGCVVYTVGLARHRCVGASRFCGAIGPS
jgi:predicted alpha/beta hydrolase